MYTNYTVAYCTRVQIFAWIQVEDLEHGVRGWFHKALRNCIRIFAPHFMAKLVQQMLRCCVAMQYFGSLRYKQKWCNLRKVLWNQPHVHNTQNPSATEFLFRFQEKVCCVKQSVNNPSLPRKKTHKPELITGFKPSATRPWVLSTFYTKLSSLAYHKVLLGMKLWRPFWSCHLNWCPHDMTWNFAW